MKELKKLQSALKGIHLSKEEKAEGNRAFMKFMEKNPMEGTAKHGFLISFYLRMRRPVLASAMAFGILVVSTGGVTYASESALPGDFLYPFKVDVVEEVRGAFQFTPEGKAEWDAKLMRRRFVEAQKLKDQDKLSVEFKSQIREKMEEHKQAFEDHLEELEDKGKPDRAEEIEMEFQFIFEQQQRFQEEWKPDFEIRPLPGMLPEDNPDSLEEEEDVETEEPELETEVEVELQSEEDESEGEEEKELTIEIEDELKID